MCEEKLSYWLVYNYLSNAPPNINAPPKAKGGALYQNKGYLPDYDVVYGYRIAARNYRTPL